MAELVQFKRGEVLYHPRRPEWGEGVVEQAVNINHEGAPAQRLVITFANHGRVTINTAIATLVPKEDFSSMLPSSSSAATVNHSVSTKHAPPAGRVGWLDALDQSRNGGETHELWRLPEAMTDPFQPLSKRLQATLDSYRFGNDPRHARNILDWAVAQTRLNDPLSKYARHELEQGFRRFARDRDNHLFDLVRQLKRQSGQNVLAQAVQAATDPLTKQTLERAIRA